MDLAAQLRDQLAHAHLTPDERALLRCRLAKELEESGDYEDARTAMGELWRRIGERPNLEGLNETAQAEVLLRVGVLTGWIGSVKQMPDVQETAKDLITESITIFERLRESSKVDEAQTDLAYCYWRQGRFDDARVLLRQVLDRLADSESAVKMVAVIRSAIIEWTSKRYHDALRIQTEYAPLFDRSANDALKGKFHNGFGIVLDLLGTSEKREDYIDRAFVEYTASSFHFERAGHFRYAACVENNLAMLHLAIGNLTEAHEHLDHAQRMLASMKDSVHLAQVNETRAKVLLAEGRNDEAEKAVRAAVQTLEQGDEQALLAESLTTHGVALARTGEYASARATLERAAAVAEQAGDKATAGRAALTIIEELSEHAAPSELGELFEQAAEALADSGRGVSARLAACARVVVRRLRPALKEAGGRYFGVPKSWEQFSLRKEVRRYERFLIELALKDTGGIVSKAAWLLGYKHHHSLSDIINKRHRSLLSARTPVVRRRPRQVGVASRTAEKRVRPVTILHAEDDRFVAETVRDTLEMEGWRVISCGDGAAALKRIEGHAPYDVLLLDNELPQINGIELVRRARQLPHRRRTPIVMLSAGDYEREARRAGANAFLRKPDDVVAIAETIARLIALHPRR